MRRPLDWLAGKTGIGRGELRWAAWFAAIVMAATCLPYLHALAVAPPHARFMGFIYNVQDNNVYMGWMREAINGRWLFKDPFTTEPQPGRGFFNVFFLALGLAARGLHVEPIWPYHAARLIFGFLALLTTYVFAARFCESVPARRLALGLVGLSSGFGWAWALLRPGAANYPIDFGSGAVVPEAVTFLSLLIFPLFAISVWLILMTYLLLLRAWDTGSRKALVGASVAALLLANIHTYDAAVVYSVVVGALLAKAISERRLPWREAGISAVLVAVSIWPVVYQYVFFRTDPVFQAKALTETLTPGGRWVASGLGLPLLLAIPGGVMGLTRRRLLFPAVWVVVNWLIVAYAPLSFQRKMIEGMQIPICILAAAFAGDWWLCRRPDQSGPREPAEGLPYGISRRRGASLVAVAIVLLTMPSNAFFLQRVGHNLRANSEGGPYGFAPPLYLTDDEFAAMRWLREHTRPGDAVLSTSAMGAYLPGVAGSTVFVGHSAETMHFQSKLRAVGLFFTAMAPDAVRLEIVRRHHLRYLFFGPLERRLALLGGFDPSMSPWMERVCERGEVTIFRFAPPAEARGAKESNGVPRV